jgi:16S rRNA (adenine1518-N6/adenine1519-N6)-dimethyltransferase
VNSDQLQEAFAELDLQPSRKLGQSFLTDDEFSAWIVDQLAITKDDSVIEVGPGFGALTEHLAGRCRSLTLIEKDGRLAKRLDDLFAEDPTIEMQHGDAVAADVRPWFVEGGVKLIGNLPYSAGSEILRTFLAAPTPVTRAVIMVQKEVGERLCAAPGSRAFGAFSVRMQARWKIRHLRTVGPEPFYPRPAVDSSILCFEPLDPGSLPPFSGEAFDSLVARGFSHRRKQLRKNLNIEPEDWAALSEKLGFPVTVRAEEISLESWVALSDELDDHPGKAGAQSDKEMFDVVDDDDAVVRQEQRALVHAQGLLHRAVHMFVFNKTGELYLARRSHLKDTHPRRWGSSAAGHLDAGEDYETAASRELQEELRILPKDKMVRLLKLPASADTDQEFVELFACRPAAGGKIRTHGSEVAEGRYFPLDLIDQWMAARPDDFTPGFRACYQAWRHGP